MRRCDVIERLGRSVAILVGSGIDAKFVGKTLLLTNWPPLGYSDVPNFCLKLDKFLVNFI